MGKVIVFVIILMLALFAFSIYYYYSDKDLIKDIFKDNENIQEENGDLGSIDSSSTSSSGTSSREEIEGESGAGTGSAGGDNISLPDDLETSPCGLYYQEYNICTGVCNIGTCVSEGRSCFCRKS